MSEEIKTTEQTEQTDLSEQELAGVAGGKKYFESRSNISEKNPVTPLPITPKAGGTSKAG